jgi:PAS domain S-box-containing protein
MAWSPKILIVDDEPRLCESLSQLLKTRRYAVSTAISGREALELIAQADFDLAILDVHLSDMLGTRLMDAIKARNLNTAVIIVSGDADIDSALDALRFGAFDYLRKPLEFEGLLKTVENALNQKILIREKESINQKLARSEEQYRYLVQNSPDIIYTLDANGNFTFLSDALEHLLGFTVKDLIGKHYSTIVWDNDREKAQWFFDERRSRERAPSEVELRLKAAEKEQLKDDTRQYLTVELKSMGIYEQAADTGKRQFIGTHGVIRDISERQRLARQLQNAERMKSLGTLAGGIAHDFNNLLMGIQGRAALVSMDLGKSNPLSEHLRAIDEYIQSAAHLTKQLLGFARAGKYEVRPTDVNDLVRNSADMFGRTRKELTIQTRFHASNVVAEVDRRQIEQVLLNLYVNAWHAMPDGGILRIETDIENLQRNDCNPHQWKQDRYAHVSVTDTGIGMDQETIQRIFDPFFTTKEKSRGTGLGLASAYGIIKNHGGFINAHSRLGSGTTFDVYLPVSDKTAADSSSSEPATSKGKETILLVDDEDMIIDVGQALIEKLGYRVITAKSGREAVTVVKRIGLEIDLVILDMIMPNMDGGKTFDQIRKIYPEIPVILSSGYAIDGQAERIMKRGCNGFIQKPFGVSVLSQKIRHVLDGIKYTL